MKNHRDVLKYIVLSSSDPIHFRMPLFSARMIARNFKISIYRARKSLRFLSKKGYIKYTNDGGGCRDYDYEYGCQCENHLPIWGYIPTEKGEKMFEQHLKDESKRFDEWCRIGECRHYNTRYNHPELVKKIF